MSTQPIDAELEAIYNAAGTALKATPESKLSRKINAAALLLERAAESTREYVVRGDAALELSTFNEKIDVNDDSAATCEAWRALNAAWVSAAAAYQSTPEYRECVALNAAVDKANKACEKTPEYATWLAAYHACL